MVRLPLFYFDGALYNTPCHAELVSASVIHGTLKVLDIILGNRP